MPGFCRDCRRDVPDGSGRCSGCGSPRVLHHSELETLAIAHVDCDAFYASIEKRDDASLKDKPVVVGGGARGVVLTACYVARTFGIKSAMPMFEARRLCPHATIVSPRMDEYARIGREVRALMGKLTPIVEPVSIDEAFMDLSGTSRLHGTNAAKALSRFAHEVENDLGITVSIGLSCNKFLAKIASDLDKPRGFAVLGREEASAFLAPKSVTWIFGVGKIAQQRLARDGVRTIGDLQRLGERELMRRYGAEGRRLARLSLGRDDVRARPCGFPAPRAALVAALRESLLTAQAQRACRLDRDAQAQVQTFACVRERNRWLTPPSWPDAFSVSDATCSQPRRTEPCSVSSASECHRSVPQTERSWPIWSIAVRPRPSRQWTRSRTGSGPAR